MTSSVHPPAPAASAAGAGPARVVPPLTDRERVVLTVMATGLTAKAAARRLGISDRTLRRALEAAVRRLGAVCAIHAVALAADAGQLDMGAVRERRVPAWPDRMRGSPSAEAARARRARYAELRAEGARLEDAANALGVLPETCRRYEAFGAGGPDGVDG